MAIAPHDLKFRWCELRFFSRQIGFDTTTSAAIPLFMSDLQG
jgi:hypothetical protein